MSELELRLNGIFAPKDTEYTLHTNTESLSVNSNRQQVGSYTPQDQNGTRKKVKTGGAFDKAKRLLSSKKNKKKVQQQQQQMMQQQQMVCVRVIILRICVYFFFFLISSKNRNINEYKYKIAETGEHLVNVVAQREYWHFVIDILVRIKHIV